MKKIAPILLLLLPLLAACGSSIKLKRLDGIVERSSTYEQVVDRLGEPTKEAVRPDGSRRTAWQRYKTKKTRTGEFLHGQYTLVSIEMEFGSDQVLLQIVEEGEFEDDR